MSQKIRNDIGTIVEFSKEIEQILKKDFNAKGKGLHGLLNSIKNYKLPDKTLKSLRWIASTRNKVLHEEDIEIKNIKQFIETSKKIIIELKTLRIIEKIKTNLKIYLNSNHNDLNQLISQAEKKLPNEIIISLKKISTIKKINNQFEQDAIDVMVKLDNFIKKEKTLLGKLLSIIRYLKSFYNK